MNGAIYGYVRVSAANQHTDRQLIAMQNLAIPNENLFVEKQSGKNFQRKQYQKLVQCLKPKDLLYIKSIDRLGRNYNEILEQWRILTKEKRIDIVVLDMPLLDTRQWQDTMGTLISDIVLQLLSYVAQKERDNIHQQQAEGIEAAKQRGVRFGRKRMELPENFTEFAIMWQEGAISSRQAADTLGMSYKTFLRRAKEVSPHDIGTKV